MDERSRDKENTGRRPGEERKENRGEENISAGQPSITVIFVFKCNNR
jgi:hypothetical protein